MSQIKVLLTCPPMISNIQNYLPIFKKHNIECIYPNVIQTLSEKELMDMMPEYDAWIAGDDPATFNVLNAGKQGKLKALIKWGVGIDNVDQEACKKLGLYFSYTPGMFGEEVSDIAIGYLLMLNRKLHEIDNKVKNGVWYKPRGISLYGKKVCVVGFGDIGQNLVRKLFGFNVNIHVTDPQYEMINSDKIYNKTTQTLYENKYNIKIASLEHCMQNSDYVVVTCSLNKHTYHLINKNNLVLCKKGVKLINVARGSVVKESDVVEMLETKHIDSVAFDVFEEEPLSENNRLRNFSNNIFGSHNSSNTNEGVDRTSILVIEKLVTHFSLNSKL